MEDQIEQIVHYQNVFLSKMPTTRKMRVCEIRMLEGGHSDVYALSVSKDNITGLGRVYLYGPVLEVSRERVRTEYIIRNEWDVIAHAKDLTQRTPAWKTLRFSKSIGYDVNENPYALQDLGTLEILTMAKDKEGNQVCRLRHFFPHTITPYMTYAIHPQKEVKLTAGARMDYEAFVSLIQRTTDLSKITTTTPFTEADAAFVLSKINDFNDWLETLLHRMDTIYKYNPDEE